MSGTQSACQWPHFGGHSSQLACVGKLKPSCMQMVIQIRYNRIQKQRCNNDKPSTTSAEFSRFTNLATYMMRVNIAFFPDLASRSSTTSSNVSRIAGDSKLPSWTSTIALNFTVGKYFLRSFAHSPTLPHTLIRWSTFFKIKKLTFFFVTFFSFGFYGVVSPAHLCPFLRDDFWRCLMGDTRTGGL